LFAAGLVAVAPRRAVPRETGGLLRLARAGAFFGGLFEAAEAFFDLWRVFAATAHAWNTRSLTTDPRENPKKLSSPLGAFRVNFHCCRYITHFSPKSKPYRTAKSRKLRNTAIPQRKILNKG
jgi:hypothetical protein